MAIRHTAAHSEQGNPQAGRAQAPERHVFGIKGYETVFKRAVGGHVCHSGFRDERKGGDERDWGYATGIYTRIFVLVGDWGVGYIRAFLLVA